MNRMEDPARLDAEIASLKQRLEEAEDMRRAITNGEVDAFVVGQGENNSRVLLLAGAYQRYRQVVERMQQGAVTVSVSGDVLFANQRFSDMLGVPMSKLFAAPLEAYVAAPDRARLSSFLLVAARNSSIEVRFANDTGTPIVARVSLASFSDGYLTLLITDLGPLHRLAEACDQLSSVREALTALGRASGLDAATRKSAEAIGTDLTRLCGSLTSLLDENAAVAAAHTATESPSTVNR
jgi:PAS domain-containing protein